MKNVLLSLKKRSRRGACIRSYVYQVKRGSFQPRPSPLPLLPILATATRSSPDFILYFPPVSYLLFYFSLAPVVSRTITSLGIDRTYTSPEIPTKRTSRVSARINFRKRKPASGDCGHASRKSSGIHARLRTVGAPRSVLADQNALGSSFIGTFRIIRYCISHAERICDYVKCTPDLSRFLSHVEYRTAVGKFRTGGE